MANSDTVLTVLGWFVLITLMCAIARQLSEQLQLNLTPSLYGASWNRPNSSHKLLERFTNPATTTTPYTLLNDVLLQKESAGTLTAKTCYEKDFLAQTAKTGNFLQRTNNYRHGAPDNCSAPHTEFIDSFYRNP